MLTSWLMLVLAAAVAPWPLETPSVPPDAPEEFYARLETMNPPVRQAWVQAMLTRLDRANQVFLDPWEVRRQHARVETAMQPFVEGKPDWRRRAEFLNHELRVGQQAAVEHLSRQYRVEIYNSYRFSRPEYNRRRAALAQLIDQWTDAGALPGQEYKVVDWLLSAAERSAAAGALPPIPSFAPEPLPATSIAVAEPPNAPRFDSRPWARSRALRESRRPQRRPWRCPRRRRRRHPIGPRSPPPAISRRRRVSPPRRPPRRWPRRRHLDRPARVLRRRRWRPRR
ncbi:MAG: hypothetical protein NTW96_11230 [Planctomycetia bacterium]|nr:hypothetical protein [Planctomycetia bacterium]